MPNDNNNDESLSDDIGRIYSRKISQYFYGKISSIRNGDGTTDDFTQSEITEYGLTVSNNRIDISTTGKLINYLKSFVKKYVDSSISNINSSISGKLDESEYNLFKSYVEDAIDEINEKFYPVGCIYISFNPTNPHDIYGGEWEKLEDKFLLGSGSRNINSVGGESSHTLTVSEMPIHTHEQDPHKHRPSDNLMFLTSSDNIKIDSNIRKAPISTSGFYYTYTSNTNSTGIGQRSYTNEVTATSKNSGGDTAHNNMPPYIVVHMWRRIS